MVYNLVGVRVCVCATLFKQQQQQEKAQAVAAHVSPAGETRVQA